jgi:hypothetical protein
MLDEIIRRILVKLRFRQHKQISVTRKYGNYQKACKPDVWSDRLHWVEKRKSAYIETLDYSQRVLEFGPRYAKKQRDL